MKKTKLLYIVCCIVFISLLVACQINKEKQPEASDNTEIRSVEDTQTVVFVDYNWVVLKKEDAYTENTVILTGEVSNVRYTTVDYEFMDTNVSDKATLFDIKVDKVLSCTSDLYPDRDCITVGVGYTMSTYNEELPVITEGARYLLFCYVTADDKDDVRETYKYADCWICYPKDLLCENIDGYYLVNNFFSDIPSAVSLAGAIGVTKEDASDIFSHVSKEYIKRKMEASSKRKVISEEVALSCIETLKVRAGNGADQLWNIMKNRYLIEETAFENHIRKTAESFSGR